MTKVFESESRNRDIMFKAGKKNICDTLYSNEKEDKVVG